MRRSGVAVMCLSLLVAACSDDGDDGEATADPGALITTSAKSRVGVVLDEIPEAMRDRVAEDLMTEPDSFWVDRAKAQLRLTGYRLIFRYYFYEDEKGQLPLPPEQLWDIELNAEPTRTEIQGHDMVAVDYSFSSTLLTDAESAGTSEPELAEIGGSWSEPFNLPLDPELIVQRSDFACIDESDYPFHSVDSEEVDSFFDQEADVEEGLSSQQAHYTKAATESCLDALENHIGRIDTEVEFERIPWDADTADAIRVGEVTGDEPDLQVYKADSERSRFTYRYIHESDCAIAERSVGGTGWRRLLQFATSDENVGNLPLVLGEVNYGISDGPQELDEHNLFEFSECHKHFHFNYYGDIGWEGSGDVVNSKLGFCLQSTDRTANREASPLFNDFGSCYYQGIAAGWVDEYQAGLPNQWLDTTDFPKGEGERSFSSNPKGLICEGTFVDEKGEPIGADGVVVWGPTDFVASNGHPVEAQLCELRDGWDDNNRHGVTETLPPHGQGLITERCTRGQIGPLRNCGFSPDAVVSSCVAGALTALTLTIPDGADPQVVRVSEFSHVLDTPIPARYEDSWAPLEPGVSDQPYMLGNFVVTSAEPLSATVTCPGPRDGGAPEPGGKLSVYSGPVYPKDDAALVTMAMT